MDSYVKVSSVSHGVWMAGIWIIDDLFVFVCAQCAHSWCAQFMCAMCVYWPTLSVLQDDWLWVWMNDGYE